MVTRKQKPSSLWHGHTWIKTWAFFSFSYSLRILRREPPKGGQKNEWFKVVKMGISGQIKAVMLSSFPKASVILCRSSLLRDRPREWEGRVYTPHSYFSRNVVLSLTPTKRASASLPGRGKCSALCFCRSWLNFFTEKCALQFYILKLPITKSPP